MADSQKTPEEMDRQIKRADEMIDSAKDTGKSKALAFGKSLITELRKEIDTGFSTGREVSSDAILQRSGFDELTTYARDAIVQFSDSNPFVLSEGEKDANISSMRQAQRRAVSYMLRETERIKQTIAGPLQSFLDVASSERWDKRNARVIVPAIAPIVRRTMSQYVVALDTALSGYQTDVQVREGKDAEVLRLSRNGESVDREPYYYYAGPSGDAIIRPFCDVLVGMAIPERLLSRLDNGQGLPVSKHLGGYNCRHSFVIVSREYVDQEGIPIATMEDIKKANAAAKRGKRGA